MSDHVSMQMPEQLAPFAFRIADLHSDPNNARVHNERNMELVRKSLQEHGWRSVIVARRSDRRILAGHARAQAAQQLGWEMAPVLFVEDDDRRAAAFAIADNRTAELSSWDNAALQELLHAMPEDERYDLGFSLEEFEQLVNPTMPEDLPASEWPEAEAPNHRLVRKANKATRRSVLLLFKTNEYASWKLAIQRAGCKKTSETAEFLVNSMEKFTQ